MARQREQQQSDPVVAAIERVLKAERDGVQQLSSSREEAQRLLNEARASAAAIAQRVDACISKLHTAYLKKIQRHIQTLTEAEAALGEGAAHGYDRAALEAAARRVAAKLTGGV
jgi:vacuolar-type H+-ATPase subunit H